MPISLVPFAFHGQVTLPELLTCQYVVGKENIAIAELAVYIPSVALAIGIIFGHGFSEGRPWIYLILFCGLRIASAILGILSAKNPANRDDATWTAILGSIGLSPLFLVASGLLRRVYVYLA